MITQKKVGKVALTLQWTTLQENRNTNRKDICYFQSCQDHSTTAHGLDKIVTCRFTDGRAMVSLHKL